MCVVVYMWCIHVCCKAELT